MLTATLQKLYTNSRGLQDNHPSLNILLVIKGEKDGGAIGAIIGGMLGHSNSNASGGSKRVCQVETRYTEESRRVYSHSTISFIYEGKSYRVNFKK